jgi:hypothetical protein
VIDGHECLVYNRVAQVGAYVYAREGGVQMWEKEDVEGIWEVRGLPEGVAESMGVEKVEMAGLDGGLKAWVGCRGADVIEESS